MARHGMSTADRAFIEAQGGVIRDTADGYGVDFPEQAEPQRFAADEIEAAVDRAAEYGTQCHPLWRPRGEGWYVAESRAEHPGCWYVCQLDERTGQPLSCECAAAVVCHHAGAAVRLWRQRVGYEANGAVVAAEDIALRARIRDATSAGVAEEAWT